MKDPSARTTANARQVMGATPHRSVRSAPGQAYVFCSIEGPAKVTLADAERLMNLGLICMQRLTDADGWEYVLCGMEHCPHVGERLAAVATFKDIHINPATRHRFGQYDPPPKSIDTSAVVSCFQTTSHPWKERK